MKIAGQEQQIVNNKSQTTRQNIAERDRGEKMEACTTDVQLNSNFEELRSEMETDIYWVRFFCRPCCPAPDVEGAIKMLDRLKSEVEDCNDYSQSEKTELVGIIENRKDWYPHSGLCRR